MRTVKCEISNIFKFNGNSYMMVSYNVSRDILPLAVEVQYLHFNLSFCCFICNTIEPYLQITPGKKAPTITALDDGVCKKLYFQIFHNFIYICMYATSRIGGNIAILTLLYYFFIAL